MTEQRTHKRRFRALGTGLAVCAAAATMVVGVAAANPEAAQEFFAHITSVVTVGEFRRDLTTEEGEQVTVLELPQATVENRDGRAILVVDGEETDVTDQLESTGRYTRAASSDGTQVDITVEGSAAEWTLTTEVKNCGRAGLYPFQRFGWEQRDSLRRSGRGYRDRRLHL